MAWSRHETPELSSFGDCGGDGGRGSSGDAGSGTPHVAPVSPLDGVRFRPIKTREKSAFLERTTVRHCIRIRTHTCVICGATADEWCEKSPADHYSREDHTWEALQQARMRRSGKDSITTT